MTNVIYTFSVFESVLLDLEESVEEVLALDYWFLVPTALGDDGTEHLTQKLGSWLREKGESGTNHEEDDDILRFKKKNYLLYYS